MSIEEVRHIATTADSIGSDPMSVSRNYTSTYTAIVSDERVGPLEILRHFQNDPDLPWHGRGYKSNSGERDNSSICKRLSVPTRVKGTSNAWNLDAEFEDVKGTPSEGSQAELKVGFDVNGKPTTDAFSWHDEIDVSYTQVSVPVEVATFRGFENPGINNPFLPPGKVGAVCNSALTPFRPKPEMELDVKVIRITRNVHAWDDDKANAFQGTVNNAEARIIKPGYGFAATIAPFCGRIKSIGGSYRNYFWTIFIEIHINPLGWRARIVDAGLDRLVAPGLPDGHGGTYSASDVPADGLPHTKPLTDATGAPIFEVVPFNGRGFPKKKEEKDVVMLWSYYEERSWDEIPW